MLSDSTDVTQFELDRMLRLRFDRPLRPLLQDVLGVIHSDDTPSVAYQRLLEAGMVEPGLFESSQRLYAPYVAGNRIRPSSRPRPESFPLSLETIVAIAADQDGILRAEHSALEFAKRLKPFHAVCNNCVVWYLSENLFRDCHPYETTHLGQAYYAAEMTIELSLESAGIDMARFRVGEPSERMPLLVQFALAGWEGWRMAQLHDLSLIDEFCPIGREDIGGFRDLQNPFAPLIDTWLTGYRISTNFNEDDPAIHLFANPVDLP